jgi:hypothetical protein
LEDKQYVGVNIISHELIKSWSIILFWFVKIRWINKIIIYTSLWKII